jgi:hypothetical protein
MKRVHPIDPGASSEWFILSAVVVRASNENAVGRWQRDILKSFGYTQRTDIHYRKLSPIRKRKACEYIAERDLRLFIVISNKKNMRGYSNPRCAEEPYFFYWWCTRLLLERVTRFCAKKSLALYEHHLPVKMVFSQRGGMSYPRLLSYLRLIRLQSEVGSLYLKEGDLAWPVVDLEQIHDIAHKNEAGLQLADVIAGAFHDAVSTERKLGPDPTYAKLLLPRFWRGPNGIILEHGVKPMPQLRKAALLPLQRPIFEAVGYPPGRW